MWVASSHSMGLSLTKGEGSPIWRLAFTPLCVLICPDVIKQPPTPTAMPAWSAPCMCPDRDKSLQIATAGLLISKMEVGPVLWPYPTNTEGSFDNPLMLSCTTEQLPYREAGPGLLQLLGDSTIHMAGSH